MKSALTIRDETTSGQTLREWMLDVLAERITVREILRSRVHHEVEEFNRSEGLVFNGLVQPADTEAALNSYRLKKRRSLDWKQQFERAVEAFERGQVLVLVGDRQIESLEDTIEVRQDTVVSFLRLVPLVGG